MKTNASIMKDLFKLEDGQSAHIMRKLQALIDRKKYISYKKACKIGALLFTVSSSFANGAVILTEQRLSESHKEGSISRENLEMGRMLLRQMFSARDGESSKGKENFNLLLNLLNAIFYPTVTDIKEDLKKTEVTSALMVEASEYPSFEILGKTIKKSMETRKSGAVTAAVIEYYTPVLIKLLDFAYRNGLIPNDSTKTIKSVTKDQSATLYLRYHANTETTHVGYHVYRTLLRGSEYQAAQPTAQKIVSLFVDAFKEIEHILDSK